MGIVCICPNVYMSLILKFTFAKKISKYKIYVQSK
jgi:hypothetical protein